jgi:diguanylate cyclase (GGDEF)-like protein
MKQFWHDLQLSSRPYLSLPLSRLIVFPILTLLAITALWASIYLKVNDTYDRMLQENREHAQNITQIFDQYTARAIRQVDQISRFVVFENQKNGYVPSLKDLTDKVLISPATPVLLSVTDPRGIVYLSSQPIVSQVSIADRQHFIVAKNDDGTHLFISQPVIGRVSKQKTIQVTRKLITSDGSFDGVVIVSIDPSIFSSFYNTEDIGEDGFIGVAGTDGVFRATKYMGAEKEQNHVMNAEVLHQKNGVMITNKTHDGKSRFVAWHKLDGYDLIVVVGLSEREFMADYYLNRSMWCKIGALASLCLLFLGALFGMLYCRAELGRRHNALAKEAYRTASEGTQDGFFILEPVKNMQNQISDFIITDANDKGIKMFGSTTDKMIGSYLSKWFGGKMGEQVFRHYRALFINNKSIEQPEVLVECDNALKGHWMSHRVVPTPSGLAITVRDISKSKEYEQSMIWLANHDAVTQLRNRTWLQNNLSVILDKAKTEDNIVALYFIDLDDFKKVNDTLGHASGDTLLSIVGERLKSIAQESDVVCRIGGDEFTLVVTGKLTYEHLGVIGQKILSSLSQPITIDEHVITVGASVGISYFPEHGTDASQLLKRADLAMYKAKYTGKGTCEFFLPALSIEADERLQLEKDMRYGIEHDEFFLVFQPKICLKTQKILGMEALMRWRNARRGIVNPAEFIPMAERTGMILTLGQQAIDKACAQIVQWQKEGLSVPPVSVNVSPKQLQRIDLADEIQQALKRYHLPNSALEIEITESSMMDDLEMSQRKLQAVKELGVRILVDDFGTGYSSLALLKKFEVDVLKVDKSFIKDVPHNSEDCALVQAVISMAQSLNMEVVAEGIETKEQWEFLDKLGCQEGQGYYFSKPVEGHDINSWLSKARKNEVSVELMIDSHKAEKEKTTTYHNDLLVAGNEDTAHRKTDRGVLQRSKEASHDVAFKDDKVA